MNLQGNLFGGVTAAVIALPLALAFGVASGLGASAGLYGAIMLGFMAAMFGGTPTQISGPTGPMTVMVAAAVVSLHGDPAMIAATILLSGLFQILFAALKVGRFVRFIPYPVISGFMSGIGIIIILMQINPLLGAASDSATLHILATLPQTLATTQLPALLLGLAALMIVLFTPATISRWLPAPLIALVVLTAITALFEIPVTTIGEIPSSLPDLVMPDFSIEQINVIVPLGFTLALLGTIDSLLTSIVADSLTRTRHNPDRELFGQGVGNALCSLIGAIPGAGATMRTVINIKSGGTDRSSGMIHAVVLLAIVLFFAPLASAIPLAVLAGILIKVGLDILDYRFLQVWRESPGHDLGIMGAVFFVTVFIDLITAVMIGVVLASLSIVYRITQATQINLVGSNRGESEIELPEKVRVISVEGAFFFGSSSAFESQVNRAVDIQAMIIDIKQVPFLDITAIFTLKDLLANLKHAGVDTYIVAKPEHQQQLKMLNINHFFNTDHFCNHLEDAIHQINTGLSEN